MDRNEAPRAARGKSYSPILSPPRHVSTLLDPRAIRENRRLERIVADMRATSLRLLELTTPSVVKRRSRTEGAKTLS